MSRITPAQRFERDVGSLLGEVGGHALNRGDPDAPQGWPGLVHAELKRLTDDLGQRDLLTAGKDGQLFQEVFIGHYGGAFHNIIMSRTEPAQDGSNWSATMCYMAKRSRVGVREIRQNLSVYLDRVKAGEAIEITERGTPVAMLVPVPERATVVRRLVADGRATPPSLPWDSLPPPVEIHLDRPLSAILDELREDRL